MFNIYSETSVIQPLSIPDFLQDLNIIYDLIKPCKQNILQLYLVMLTQNKGQVCGCTIPIFHVIGRYKKMEIWFIRKKLHVLKKWGKKSLIIICKYF